MNTQWINAMQANGLLPTVSGDAAAGPVVDYPVNGAQLADLSSLSILDVTGADAAAFLQGQFCNDLTKVSATRAQITGYCTPKGRLLALPVIVGITGGYRLILPESIKDGFLKRLSMFVMRSKVNITERPDWIATGVLSDATGHTAEAGEYLGVLPPAAMDTATSESLQIICWPTGADTASARRFLVLASISDQIDFWKACASMPRRDDAIWRLAEIAAGVPSVNTGTLEAFVPQMLNLQVIDGLSFTKGCYPGQEIVARMQYLGKLKRHMRRFCLPPDATGKVTVPTAGDTLQAGDDQDAGIVVDAVLGADGRGELLAVVKVSADVASLLVQGQKLLPLELPYELPSLQDVRADAG